MIEHKIEKLIEETKASAVDLQKAAGYDYVHTDNPKDNFFSLMNPIQADAISSADLEQRAKTLGIDKNFLEKEMAIRDPNTSGYIVDTNKLSGYASRMHPDDISYGNTTGSFKQLAPALVANTALGAAVGHLIDPGEVGSMAAGAGLGAVMAPVGSYIQHKQGQALYDRHHPKK